MFDTKEKILEAALDLFSKQGYNSTCVDEISQIVGIKPPSLYSHYNGKKAICDALVEELEVKYAQLSPFSSVNRKKFFEDKSKFDGMTKESFAAILISHVRNSVENEFLQKGRRFVTIDQYSGLEFAKRKSDKSHEDIMAFYSELIDILIEKKILRDEDSHLMALELIAPATVIISSIDRESTTKDEGIALIEKHANRFFELYVK